MNAPINRPGWEAELRLGYEERAGRTRLVRSQRRGPLSIQRAFYPEGDLCHSYLLHPPGGVVGGDRLEVDLSVDPGAAVLLTTPGATKFYRSLGAQATLTQHLSVASGASLEWMPLENIYFVGCNARVHTEVHLEAGARFVGWEINCLGRPANSERFERGHLNSRLSVYRDGEALLFDRFATDGLAAVDAPVGLRGHSAQATFVATLESVEMAEQVQALLEAQVPQGLGGATLMDDLLCVRLIGEQSQILIKHLVDVWTLIRPQINGRIACPPRIWAT